MRRILFPILVLVAVISACTNSPKQPDGGYIITATIEGATDSIATLNRPMGRQLLPIDTVEVKDGKFVFTGKADEEEIVYIQIGTGFNSYIELFLENEKITVTGKKDNLQETKVEGGVNNTVWNGFKERNKGFQEASEQMNVKYQSADSTGKLMIEEEYKQSLKDFIQKELTSVKAEPKAFANLFILQQVLRQQLSFDEFKTAFAGFDESLKEKALYKEIAEEVTSLENVQVGKKAPDFTMNNLAGQPVALASLLGKGYLLVDFWAGWCKPCRAENPNVVAAYEKYKGKGFDILGVSLDRSKEEWEAAVKEDKLAWTQVSDVLYWDSKVVKMYGVRSIPHNLLLDKDGVIIAQDLRGEDLDSKLAELLGK